MYIMWHLTLISNKSLLGNLVTAVCILKLVIQTNILMHREILRVAKNRVSHQAAML